MREIKFRAWNTKEKVMLYRKLFEMNWYSTPKNTANSSNCWGPISGGQSRFMEPMQYTGLKDKNGVEIYEGDVVEVASFNPSRYEVVFNRGGFCMRRSKASLYYPDGKYLEDGEVIGNIYQNPELLKP
jgi:uncharacterized phage protein (TIGR01671 family)